MFRFDDGDDLKQAACKFLRQFHAEKPGDFPLFPSSIGPSSYDVLAALARDEAGQPPVVVDLGCGDGTLCSILAQRIGVRGRLYGIDNNPAQIKRVRQRLSGPNIVLSCAAADRLDHADSSVDLVISHMALGLMHPLEAVLEEVSRILVPGGRFSFVEADPENDSGIERAYQAIARRVVESEGLAGLARALRDQRLFDLDASRQLLAKHTAFGTAFEHRQFQVLLRLTAAEFVEFIAGDYAWSLVSEAGRDRIASETKRLFSGAAERRHEIPLALQQVTLVKQASA